MYCTQCGAKLREESRFCLSCGHPVPEKAVKQTDRKAAEADTSGKIPGQAKAGAHENVTLPKDRGTEASGKVLDMAKAGAREIIAMLKDRDIDAPAQAGEISCKPDAAQSAFMKLLKKGLLSLLIIIPFSLQAQSKLSGHLGPYTLSGKPGITYTLEFGNARLSDEFISCDRTYHHSDGKTIRSDIHGYFESKDYITLRVKALKADSDIEWEAVAEYGRWEDVRNPVNRKRENTVSQSKQLSVGEDAVFKIPVPDTESLMDLIVIVRQKQEEGYRVWISQERRFYLAYGNSGGSLIDTIAGDAGEHGWVLPAAVAGGLVVGGLALKGRKKKKAASGKGTASKKDNVSKADTASKAEKASKTDTASKTEKASNADKASNTDTASKKDKALNIDELSKQNEPSGKYESSREDKPDDKDDEEKAVYEMRIRKDFGDTLKPGGPSQKVYARIVRVPAGGKASTDTALTAKIGISGDAYLKVSGQSMAGEYMSASVEAPQGGSVPDEAVVNFRLSGGGGSFTNRMHFKIAGSRIVFFQENLTLPACTDDVWRLPFAVTCASQDAVIEACGSCLEAYSVKIESGEKDGLYYAVISEKVKDRKEPGTWDSYNLEIKVTDGGSAIDGSLPFYRFHMGLKLGMGDTVPCYLQTSATGKTEVSKAIAELAFFDWNHDTNDIITVSPVPTDFKITAEGSKEQGYLDKLGISCTATSITTDNGRRLEIGPRAGVLDAPTRFKATLSMTADCGKGRVEKLEKKLIIASQPVRQNVTPSMLAEDKRIGDGLLSIQSSIWDNGEYSRLFPLYKLIDAMMDGYDGAYGYDRHQVETVKDVYKRFLNGEMAGANATAERVTLADEMRLFVDSFLQTGEEVEDSMGFFTRMAIGVVTLGMSDAVFTALQVARDMKATVEKGGDALDVFTVGVKAVAWEALTDFDTWKAAGRKLAPKQYAAAARSVEKLKNQAREAASDYFSETIGKKTKGVLEKSKGVKSKAAKEAEDAIDAFRKNPQMSDLEKKLDEVYKDGQARGKAKVDELEATKWLVDNNPTPENIRQYKKKVLEVQRDKFAMHELNGLPEGDSIRAAFNKELDSVYKDVDDEVRSILRKQGYDLADTPFAATSSNKADLKAGRKVTFDRDVTYRTIDGGDVPQDAAQVAYEKAFYKRTAGMDAPSDKVAADWAQMHDQTVVQKGSKVSYEDDLNPVIKDWDKKLTDAEHTGKVMTYKSTEWFEQTEEMIRKANTLESKPLRMEMLQQALSKRQEAARQMVKQFRYVHERDVAAQVSGAASRISGRMRFGMEVSSRLFSTGADRLTLGEAEAVLAKENITLELLSSWLGDTLKAIG